MLNAGPDAFAAIRFRAMQHGADRHLHGLLLSLATNTEEGSPTAHITCHHVDSYFHGIVESLEIQLCALHVVVDLVAGCRTGSATAPFAHGQNNVYSFQSQTGSIRSESFHEPRRRTVVSRREQSRRKSSRQSLTTESLPQTSTSLRRECE